MTCRAPDYQDHPVLAALPACDVGYFVPTACDDCSEEALLPKACRRYLEKVEALAAIREAYSREHGNLPLPSYLEASWFKALDALWFDLSAIEKKLVTAELANRAENRTPSDSLTL